MKIKDHSQVKKNIFGAWSSHAILTSGVGHKFPSMNVYEYILKTAKYCTNRIKLALEYQGQQAHVSEHFDDSNFAEKFCKKLNADCIGKTIKEIGEIEIDF